MPQHDREQPSFQKYKQAEGIKYPLAVTSVHNIFPSDIFMNQIGLVPSPNRGRSLKATRFILSNLYFEMSGLVVLRR